MAKYSPSSTLIHQGYAAEIAWTHKSTGSYVAKNHFLLVIQSNSDTDGITQFTKNDKTAGTECV